MFFNSGKTKIRRLENAADKQSQKNYEWIVEQRIKEQKKKQQLEEHSKATHRANEAKIGTQQTLMETEAEEVVMDLLQIQQLQEQSKAQDKKTFQIINQYTTFKDKPS